MQQLTEESDIEVSDSSKEKLLEQLNQLTYRLEATYPDFPQDQLDLIINNCREHINATGKSEAYTRLSLMAEFHNAEKRFANIIEEESDLEKNVIHLAILDYAKIAAESLFNAKGFLTIGGVLALELATFEKLYSSAGNPQISTFTPLMCITLFLVAFEIMLAGDLAEDYRRRVEAKRNEIFQKLETEG